MSLRSIVGQRARCPGPDLGRARSVGTAPVLGTPRFGTGLALWAPPNGYPSNVMEAPMPTKRNQPTRRRKSAPAARTEPAPRPVQAMLLELTYRMHATRPVAVVRGSRSSCSSVMGGTTALRGPNCAAPALDAQFTR